jgi:hypothetical protein
MKRFLSRDDSASFVSCLERWMKAGEASTYEVSLFVGISRTTLGRWLKGGSRIPIGSGIRLLEGLTEFEKPGTEAECAVADLKALLGKPPSSRERLLAAFRVHRVRFRRAMAAIGDAGFRVVPIDTINPRASDGETPCSS